MYYPECLPPILDFLDRIEMPFKASPFGLDGFLPGIQIVKGVLHIDPDRLVGSGDVLHEAGHIVVLPSRWRSALGNDVVVTLDEAVAADPDAKDDPKLRTAIMMGELMAQAWSYAVLKVVIGAKGRAGSGFAVGEERFVSYLFRRGTA
jgi:hypothetical protein